MIGGWLIALVAWTVTASHWTIGQLTMIYLLTFGVGHFAHCIASSGEVLSAVLAAAVGPGASFSWLAPATLGDICGGVFIVSPSTTAKSKRFNVDL